MPPQLQRIAQSFTQSADRLRVRSALNPALWLCAIVGIPCGFLAAYGPPRLQIWFMALLSAVVAVAIAGFFYLLIFDRKKLQSEDYQLRTQALELLREKNTPIALLPVEPDKLMNPGKSTTGEGEQ
ncbi:MAG: hypothetical protein H0V62_08105 [Gammaproteobacteria bacterium]|nr:hypothetical protein [Gammaproteobacteria bacterium]